LPPVPKDNGNKEPPVKVVPKDKGEQPQPTPGKQVVGGWKEYSPPGANCTVMMPDMQVVSLTQDVPVPPAAKVTLHVFAAQKDLTTGYAVMYCDYPPGVIQPGLEEAPFDMAREAITQKLPGAKVTNEEKLKLDGTHRGRALTIDLQGKTTV